VVGKTIGVFGASWLAVRLGWGALPPRTTWRHIFGLAMTAGIGFTVALYVTELSFDDPALTSSAKLGVLGASVIAGVLGLLFLRGCPAVEDTDPVGEMSPSPTGGMAAPAAPLASPA
jgi:NhaA family Na+:H+ antiporter